MWPVVKQYCDNACWRVVLVRCRATGQLLAYCRGCGAAWLSPADLRTNDFAIGSEACPGGVEVPSAEEVARSLWAGCMCGSVAEGEYSTAPEINEDLAREREKVTWGSAAPRPAVGEVGPLRRWYDRIVDGLAAWLAACPGTVWYTGPGSLVDRLRRAREGSRRGA
jgi:hypothetical protein